MNYNTALRKAAEHETLSRNRVKTGTLSAAEAGIQERTAYYWMKIWCDSGVTTKIGHGRYRKTA